VYDDLSSDYDRFVDWQGRLTAELPFIERQLASVRARRVLDAACGTGKHAIALAERGYEIVGTDLSVGMVEWARADAAAARIDVRFEAAGFGELGAATRPSSGFRCRAGSSTFATLPCGMSRGRIRVRWRLLRT
jgi:glycine/sarcosine N-methyltransferase